MKGEKYLYFDIMERGRFVYQFRYSYCPLFKLDLEDVERKLYEKRPSLKGRKLEICQTEDIVY